MTPRTASTTSSTPAPAAANPGACRPCDTPTTPALPPREKFSKLAPLIDYLDTVRDRACLDTLSKLLAGTTVTRQDIAGTCVFGVKGYRRNCISKSPWYELLACCWHSGHRTPIHDHHGVSCAFKVIEGEGTEIRFRETPSGLICPAATITMPVGYICAANDADIHQVANMQAPGSDLITLHIYSPPITRMRTYDWGHCSGADLDPAASDCYETPC